MDLVSILIPVYNREKYIEETVRSALNQTYSNIEIIIVDNKSTDRTWNILNQLIKLDSRIKIFQNESNIGPVLNWKACIEKATGDYGKIVWSDDLIAPEYIERTLPFLQNDEVGFVHSNVIISTDPKIFYAENIRNDCYTTYSTAEYIEGILLGKPYPLSPGCALFRLKDLRDSLIIDIPNKIAADFKMLAIGNDLLIFLLTAIKYDKVILVQDSLVFFRVHNESITVGSEDAKVVLHYDIAKAYFVENFYYNKNIIKKLNVLFYKHLKRYNSLKYNIHDISSFYIKNTNYSQNYMYIIYRAILRGLKQLTRSISS